MKKTYEKPEVQLIDLGETISPLCGSTDTTQEMEIDFEGESTTNVGLSTGSSKPWESSSWDVFDDEEN